MHRILIVLLTLLLVAPLGTIPATAQTASPDATIHTVSYTGEDSTTLSGTDIAVWHSGSHEFTVNATSTSGVQGQLCLLTSPAGTQNPVEVACNQASIEAGSSVSVPIAVSSWPDGQTGDLDAKVVFRSGDGTVLDTHQFTLSVIQRDGDLDGDGLTNERESTLGTDLHAADTDQDGLADGVEVSTYETDPTNPDTDGDGLTDAAEVNQHKTDPTAADSDDDGLADGDEIAAGTDPLVADSDSDGLEDGPEIHVYNTDPLTADTDGDGLGDGVEINDQETNPRKSDTDGDGLSDNLEINTYETDPTRIDTDGDGLEDGAEVNRYETDPSLADSDDDGLDDGQEIHTYETDATNPDTDGDGLEDGAEVNQYGTNPTKVDTDGDGTSDLAEVRGQRLGPIGPVAAGLALLVVINAVLYRTGQFPEGLEKRLEGGLHALSAIGGRLGSDGSDQAAVDGASASQPGDPDDLYLKALSKEERIMQLLDENDGRMRQADIVDQTEWSKSTVSRVLADMESDEQVVKIDVGRGNIVTRPEDSPEGAASPFES